MPESVEKAIEQRLIPEPQSGTVVDRADPLGLHRVRVHIPGILEKSAWASPLTMGGGGPGRGGHVVPEVGADVVVLFIGGDPERPMYAAAGWGLPEEAGSEMPIDARDTDEPHLVQTMQLGSLVITVDERERDDEAGTGQLFKIEDQVSGDVLLYDREQQGWRLKGSLTVQIEADGVISLKAAQIFLNDKLVSALGRPIG